MKTELQVLERLKDVISTQLNKYLKEDKENFELLELIDSDNVEIDFPDTDNFRKKTMFWVEPQTEDIEDLTTGSDLAQMQLSIYILCKRDKSENLVKKVFGYFTALFALIKDNQTLDEFVDFTKITTMEFYPAVTADRTIAGIEASVQIQYEKPF